MNKHTPDNGAWSITDMAFHLPEELTTPIEPLGDPSITPSPDRIKQLALQKRLYSLQEKEEIPMKKTSLKILLIAAVVCAMSITVFAVTGGFEYFQGIFGESAASVRDEIVTPQVVVSADGREMALEALLTDGYQTNLVVSLTGEQPPMEELFFVIMTDLRSFGWSVLEEYSVVGKTYYLVELVNESRFEAADITLGLNRHIAYLELEFQIENHLGNAVVTFPEGAASGKTIMKELQISSMGFLLIGQETDPQGGLPATNITLLFSDGRTEEIAVEFGPSHGYVSGGGGAIMTTGPKPLVSTFHGSRNTGEELVINGQFSRIINPAGIDKVVVDGVEYLVD